MSSTKQLDSSQYNVQVKHGAVVCVEADYYGEITIGTRTVVHPKARIIAEAGPIIIGEGNLVEEQAQIINSVQVKHGAVVCVEADYYGEITIGTRTVVHPKARIIAEAGPIIIGEGNLVEEQAQIINSVQVKHGAVVCVEADYYGEITIGTRTVVHPKARIIAEAGPIIIGEGNLVEEQAQIINRLPEGAPEGEQRTLYIGNNNVFEVGSYCEAKKIGDNNVLEAKSHVGPGVELTKGCVIGSLCSLTCQEEVPENTVIYGSDHHRRVQTERPIPQGLQLDFLTKILPNYHHLIKQKRKPVPS